MEVQGLILLTHLTKGGAICRHNTNWYDFLKVWVHSTGLHSSAQFKALVGYVLALFSHLPTASSVSRYLAEALPLLAEEVSAAD